MNTSPLVPATGNRKPRICVISFARLSRLVESVAHEYADQIEVVIENRRFADAVAYARMLVERGAVDAFIGAGANGAQLRRQLDYPVVLVKVTGFDIMRALVAAARLTDQIGVVTYEQVSDELKEMSRLLNVRLELRRYINEKDAREQVHELRDMGIKAVIGPSLVTETAEQCGLQGVFIYSEESARHALDDAIEAVRVAAVEQSRRKQLAALLGTLREGVVAIDRNDRIWLANPAIGELLQTTPPEMEGQGIDRFIPGMRAGDVLDAKAEPVLRKVFSIAGRRMVGSLVAMEESGVRSAAVLTLQDASSVERAGRDLRIHARGRSLRARHTLDDLIGNSLAMKGLKELAARFAAIDLTVLILGESGTGKELVAQGIHSASQRRNEPFVAINCAAMPETLLESELFGYEEGAFTGAMKGGKPGLLEVAHRGTVFLDEVGDMPAALQVRLLRVLQEREVLRVGGRESIPIDVRVIAATHRDLGERVRSGEFRQDLYYRLNGLCLRTPALRDRREDVPALIRVVLERRSAPTLGMNPGQGMVQRFLAATQHYAWPGNVRELENMVERLIAVAASGLEDSARTWHMLFPEFNANAANREESIPAENEQAVLQAAIDSVGGNMTLAARKLGISRTTLWRKLSRR